MSSGTNSLFERYQTIRRRVEIGFWVSGFFLQAALNSVVAVLDLQRAGRAIPIWQPLVWEGTSNLVLLALVPAVIGFERRFPIHWDTLRRNLPWHLLASIVYSVVHVVAMVGLRHVAYAATDARYDFGDWLVQGGYEYLKDVRTYAAVLGIVLIYRFMMLRLQGEARLLDAPDEGAPLDSIERPARFLVRKLRKEFLIAAADIEWLQAQGNYVNLHVRGHDYLLRATMAAVETRLDPSRFARVHRSYIANLDHVVEIEPLDSGDARLLMRDGARIPCSRRYKEALHPALSGP